VHNVLRGGKARLLGGLLIALAGACSAGKSSPAATSTATVAPQPASSSPMAAPGAAGTTSAPSALPTTAAQPAVAQGPGSPLALPPGALNPDVTQATIGSTICVRGWTATVRPPVSYTEALKRRQMSERHLPGSLADYEEDHFIPLELGGAPREPANLWPEPRSGPPPVASDKDAAENRLHRSVCAGTLTLDAARGLVRSPAQWHA